MVNVDWKYWHAYLCFERSHGERRL